MDKKTREIMNTKLKIFVAVTLMLGLIFFVILLTFLFYPVNAEGELECSVNDIQYLNVSPYACWSDKFASDYCPMPKHVHCRVDADVPLSISKIYG